MSYIIWQLNFEEKELLNYITDKTDKIIYIPKKNVERGYKTIQSFNNPMFVVGDIQFVKLFFKLVYNNEICANHYPDCLQQYLYRNISIQKYKDVRYSGKTMFIKPYNNCKAFTGTIIGQGMKKVSYRYNKQVYVSDVVHFNSEYRCFVCEDKLLEYRWYFGNKDMLDLNIVNDMIGAMKDNGCHTYLLDVGVLNTGETALIEVDNAFSFGTYGCNPTTIYKMYEKGFIEMIKNNNKNDNKNGDDICRTI